VWHSCVCMSELRKGRNHGTNDVYVSHQEKVRRTHWETKKERTCYVCYNVPGRVRKNIKREKMYVA